MIPGVRRAAVVLFSAALAVSISGCAGESDQDRILNLADGIAARAEKRDVEGVLAFLTGDYMDFENRDKEATRSLIMGHLGQRFGIAVNILHARVKTAGTEGEASLVADVAVSSGAARALRKTARFIGDFFRFSLELRRTGEGWKVHGARWESVGIADLFPESLPALQKTYPNL
jgi:hypothetical protein